MYAQRVLSPDAYVILYGICTQRGAIIIIIIRMHTEARPRADSRIIIILSVYA